jgi:hypothetical protein
MVITAIVKHRVGADGHAVQRRTSVERPFDLLVTEVVCDENCGVQTTEVLPCVRACEARQVAIQACVSPTLQLLALLLEGQLGEVPSWKPSLHSQARLGR